MRGGIPDANTPLTTKAPRRGLSFALTLLARPPLPSRERRKKEARMGKGEEKRELWPAGEGRG